MARVRSARRAPFNINRQRRKTLWLFSADQNSLQALAANGSVLEQTFQDPVASGLGPFTIVRTVGTLFIRSDQEAASEDAFGAFGFIVSDVNAVAAGVGSIPTPITDEGADWFGLLYWETILKFSSATGIDAQGGRRIDFDFRSMRKVDEDMQIIVVAENASGVAGANFVSKFRMLVKLH